MSIADNIQKIKKEISKKVKLVAVSKTMPVNYILEAYEAGQVVFGENKVQDLIKKYEKLPKNIEWHMIGHLQKNKVKYIAPFIKLIHSVDSIKILKEIDKRASQNNRIIECLLQVNISKEITKFGFMENEIEEIISDIQKYKNLKVIGLMGMASFTNDKKKISEEFSKLYKVYKKYKILNTLSMGMSNDYNIAIKCGSTMVRIGSTIFGEKKYN